MNCDDSVDTLDNKVTIQLFRMIQECLTNINRHAEAGRVTITLAIDPENKHELLVQVFDNGQGCSFDNISTGFGLLGMQERIKSLDGELSVISQPGEGMKVSATIPLA